MYNESEDIFCQMSVLFHFLHQLILAWRLLIWFAIFFPVYCLMFSAYMFQRNTTIKYAFADSSFFFLNF